MIKKIKKIKDDSIFTDQKVERREEDIKGKKTSQHHDIDCVEFWIH